MKFKSDYFKYLILVSCLSLSACASPGTMNGMIRGSGKQISIGYTQSFQHDNLQVMMPDGEFFTGKAVKANSSTSTVMVGGNFGVVQNNTGNMQAVLFGNKGRTMNCKFHYADSSGYTTSGGVGVCETSSGKIIDVQW